MTQRPPLRPAQYQAENEASAAARGDRIANRPRTLRALLRWAQQNYSLEAPPRLHDRDVADDGAPDHTGEAKGWFGMAQGKEHDHAHARARDGRCLTCEAKEPPHPGSNDWRKVACRTDDNGSYLTPMRCAVERVPGEERRKLLRALLPNVFFPSEAAAAANIPEWCQEDVMRHALTLLWDRYQDRPLPLPSKDKSDAQLDAEAA